MCLVWGIDLRMLENFSANTKKKPLPKHRKLMIESLELLFSGKTTEANKKIKEAKAEVNKFYSK